MYDEDGDCNLSLFHFFFFFFFLYLFFFSLIRWDAEWPAPNDNCKNGERVRQLWIQCTRCQNEMSGDSWLLFFNPFDSHRHETRARVVFVVLICFFFLESKKHELPSNLSEFMQSLRLMDLCSLRFFLFSSNSGRKAVMHLVRGSMKCGIYYAATAVLDKAHTQHARWVNKSLWLWHGRHIAHRFIIKSEWQNNIQTEMRTQRVVPDHSNERRRRRRQKMQFSANLVSSRGLFGGLMSLPVALIIIVIHFTCAIDH